MVDDLIYYGFENIDSICIIASIPADAGILNHTKTQFGIHPTKELEKLEIDLAEQWRYARR